MIKSGRISDKFREMLETGKKYKLSDRAKALSGVVLVCFSLSGCTRRKNANDSQSCMDKINRAIIQMENYDETILDEFYDMEYQLPEDTYYYDADGNIVTNFTNKDMIKNLADMHEIVEITEKLDFEQLPDFNGTIEYRIKLGDCLKDIVEDYNQDLIKVSEENGITNPDLIIAGSYVKIDTTKNLPVPEKVQEHTSGVELFKIDNERRLSCLEETQEERTSAEHFIKEYETDFNPSFIGDYIKSCVLNYALNGNGSLFTKEMLDEKTTFVTQDGKIYVSTREIPGYPDQLFQLSGDLKDLYMYMVDMLAVPEDKERFEENSKIAGDIVSAHIDGKYLIRKQLLGKSRISIG